MHVQWLEYLWLNVHPRRWLSEEQKARLAELDRRDEQVGDRLALLFPFFLLSGGVLVIVVGLVLYGC
jgi:hypothetical protein